MLKKNLFKSATLILSVICILSLAACGGDPAEKSTEQTSSQSSVETENNQSDPVSSEPESTSSEASPEAPESTIAKISGAADDVGIYSVVVKLTDEAADKGKVEMVYYGPKGSPQEKSIVNTFRIEYYKDSSGKFEIQTFSDGEVYQNLHQKEQVNVTNTFGATTRAGNVIISYTPDGGETQEIFKADADYFRSSSN